MRIADRLTFDRIVPIRQGAARRPWTWRLAWSLCGVSLVLLVPTVILTILNRNAPDIWVIAEPQTIPGPAVYGVVGALLASRLPRNAIGWLFLGTGIVASISSLADLWGVYGLVTHPGAPGAALALWCGLAVSASLLVPVYPLLLFPSGGLPGWPSKLIALVAGVATASLVLSLATGNFAPPGFPAIYEQTPNPLAFDRELIDPVVFVLTLLLCGLISVGMLLTRTVRSRGATRQQYKWVVMAMSLIIATTLADFIARSSGSHWYVVTSPALTIAILLTPAAMGVAILRYRLYDIDVIISRTLVYLALSASIVGIYVFVVGWLGTVFRTGGNLVFSLLATAVVAVLFQPLREGIQRGVNRLLFGERDDPYAVISRLGRRLEDTLAPDAVLDAIAGTVREALKLPYSAIAMADGGAVVAVSGRPVEQPLRLPLLYQHEPVGELLLGPRAPGEEFGPADRRLLDDLARQAGVAVHAVQLTRELQLARERLVEAREEERRRLRRDLHDGLGSQLAALNLQAGTVRRLIESDPAAAQAEVSELRGQLQAAIASIRTLVHGLRPPAIDELGLAVALRERARQYNDEGLIVETDLPEALGELPAAVEVAVYRIVEEALANVVRHAQAGRCVVRLSRGDALELSIEDDGVGLMPQARAGVGLVSMRERAEELGGRCVVEARPGGGTRVAVRLPLERRGEGTSA